MGGAVKRTTKPISYFEIHHHGEAPIKAGTKLAFHANGSYAFSDAARMKLIPTKALRYRWRFGDGGKAWGRNRGHTYKKPGSYAVTLTVIAPAGARNTMKSIVIIAEGWTSRGISSREFHNEVSRSRAEVSAHRTSQTFFS